MHAWLNLCVSYFQREWILWQLIDLFIVIYNLCKSKKILYFLTICAIDGSKQKLIYFNILRKKIIFLTFNIKIQWIQIIVRN